jgi:multidrug efflux pump
VIFLFLRNWRATLIPFVTIPVSLIGAFIFLYAMGFSINVLTLLGMVLAIGLVVDDAIVMLENIYRHIEEGMPPYEAAVKGAKEIGFAVVAMTLTLVAVFAPLAFADRQYRQAVHRICDDCGFRGAGLGLRRADADADDGSQLLRHETRHGRVFNFGERMLTGLSAAIPAAADPCRAASADRHAVSSVLVAVAAFGLLKSLKSELAPPRTAVSSSVSCWRPKARPSNTPTSYAPLEGIYQDVPEITAFVVVAPGLERPNPVNTALSFVRSTRGSERRSQPDGNHGQPRPADVHGHARRARLPDQSALARDRASAIRRCSSWCRRPYEDLNTASRR